MINTKQCSTCKIEKNFTEFWKNSTMKDGYCHQCKTCKEIIRKKTKFYKLNPHLAPIISTTHKVCSVCKEEKPFSEFKKRSQLKSGIGARCIKCVSKMNKSINIKWINDHPDRWRLISRLNSFKSRGISITPDEYKILLEESGILCNICNKPNTHKYGHLCLDHNHSTGKARGLLCHKCNVAIGMVYDNVKLLQKMINYLNKHNSNLSSTLVDGIGIIMSEESLMYIG